MTPLIQKAIVFATKLHQGQFRKGTPDVPYIVHPFSVAVILSEHTDDENIIVAGLLHDILEDVKGYREADMRQDFGDKVTDLVLQVSEEKDPNIKYDERGTWKERKESYLKNLRNDETAALMICAADKIHNLNSLSSELEKSGVDILNRLNAGRDKQLWYYRQVVDIVKERLGISLLVDELEKETKRFERIL